MNILLYLAPPAVGAVIGYVTNALAIKMLFRPLRQVRLFGRVPLPFTPGILPRQRHKLADNIGRMVERELLTVDILRRRLQSDTLRKALGQSVAKYTETLLAKRLSDLPPSLGTHIARVTRGILDAPVFEEAVRSAALGLLQNISEKTLPELLGMEAEGLQDALTKLLASGLVASSDTAAGRISAAADAVYPQFTSALRAFLAQEEIRSQVEVQGRIFLRSAILKLNVFQRFFLSAAQYDRTLQDRIPDIIEDLYKQIETVLGEGETRRRITGFIGASVAHSIAAPDSAHRLARMASDWTKPLLSEGLGRVLERLGARDPENLLPRIAEAWKGANVALTEERIVAAVASFIETRSHLSIGELLGADQQRKADIDSFITDRLLEAADDRLPSAMEALDIRTLVTERIDSLEMEKVERIVLDVLANQLRWINFFGALLGALIGGAQVALSMYLGAF